MNRPGRNDPTRLSLRDGVDLADVEFSELWWRYVGLGGGLDEAAVALCVLGEEPCDARDHDLIAHALNEVFLDRDHDTFPVGYVGSVARPCPLRQRQPGEPLMAEATARCLRARTRAAVVRLRSAAASRRAAELHAASAQLLRASGRPEPAGRADARAREARHRSAGCSYG